VYYPNTIQQREGPRTRTQRVQAVTGGEIRRRITVVIPDGATPEEEQRLIDAAVDREIDDIGDDLLDDIFK
jgi:hypothetical protein